MNWLQKTSYSSETGYLKNYLKRGFDPYDYQYMVPKYLQSKGIDEYDGVLLEEYEHDWEVGELFIEKASEKELEDFENWVKNDRNSDYGSDFDLPSYYYPSYESLSYRSFIKPTWLIHFTDDPRSIVQNGFEYGHPDFEGLHLTTHKKDRKKVPGYNFAFSADDIANGRQSYTDRGRNKYGKHAVVFWGSGIHAYHSGDDEHQIIIWGPSVRKDMIFPVYNDGEWEVTAENDRVMVRGELSEAISWIKTNYRMLQRIREKLDRRWWQRNKKKQLQRVSNKHGIIPGYEGIGHGYRWDDENGGYKEVFEKPGDTILWEYIDGQFEEWDRKNRKTYHDSEAQGHGRIDLVNKEGTIAFNTENINEQIKMIEYLMFKYSHISFYVYSRDGEFRLRDYWKVIESKI